jgi:hypothetical protein
MNDEVLAAPAVKVAQDLTAITRLAERLLTQAVHSATDREMPGGDAMVALAHVANPDDYRENVEAIEWRHEANPRRYPELDLTHEDDDVAPVLQTLWFWSDALRTEHGQPLERQATITSEVRIIRHYLDYLWATEPAWDDFAGDIAKARRRLENVLKDGERHERGVPCMYDECRGVRLQRYLRPRSVEGTKVWEFTDWYCPRCKRTWTEDRYAAMVTAAHEATKTEQVQDETWCTVDVAARKVERTEGTVRMWAHRGEVATACIIAGRRGQFVCLEDVVKYAERAARRKRAS